MTTTFSFKNSLIVSSSFVFALVLLSVFGSSEFLWTPIVFTIFGVVFGGYYYFLLTDHGVKVQVQEKTRVRAKSTTTTTSQVSLSATQAPAEKKTVVKSGRLTAEEVQNMTDEEIVEAVVNGSIAIYALEKLLEDNDKAVFLRRKALEQMNSCELPNLPHEHYDYSKVRNACCENVIGYIPVPIGVAGPLLIDGKEFFIPMATTEGCLIASAHRGCKVLTQSGGVTTVLTDDGMTRAPCIRFDSAAEAGEAKNWIQKDGVNPLLVEAFCSTSRFGRIKSIKVAMTGRNLYVRFKCFTGDAMGMNMVSKGVEACIKVIKEHFPSADVLALSGNFCSDKKAAAVNWIEGRGKSVVAEAVIKGSYVEKVLKTNVDTLVDVCVSKNLIGSAMAGCSVGGFNAHASNLVTAMYIACGQDPAQVVVSSNCMTLCEKVGEDLRVSVTMPSIEVGTVGGGTILPAQSQILEMLKVKGACREAPGSHAQQLSRIVASGVLAGEISLLSALAAGHLVQSHMALNRKAAAPVAGSCIKS